jgi:hypothetical protein
MLLRTLTLLIPGLILTAGISGRAPATRPDPTRPPEPCSLERLEASTWITHRAPRASALAVRLPSAFHQDSLSDSYAAFLGDSSPPRGAGVFRIWYWRTPDDTLSAAPNYIDGVPISRHLRGGHGDDIQLRCTAAIDNAPAVLELHRLWGYGTSYTVTAIIDLPGPPLLELEAWVADSLMRDSVASAILGLAPLASGRH